MQILGRTRILTGDFQRHLMPSIHSARTNGFISPKTGNHHDNLPDGGKPCSVKRAIFLPRKPVIVHADESGVSTGITEHHGDKKTEKQESRPDKSSALGMIAAPTQEMAKEHEVF
jgi:hypothetical protein